MEIASMKDKKSNRKDKRIILESLFNGFLKNVHYYNYFHVTTNY